MRRRYRSRLPSVYEPQNLFNTPGAGAGNQTILSRAEAPGTGAPVQPRMMDPPRQNNIVPQYVPTPPGHYSNPLDNNVAAASRLAALPTYSESPVAVEARRARDLLQTAPNQHQAYSHSRERIHSTPRPSRSYSRHVEDEPTVSSSARRQNSPRGNNPAGGGANAQDVVDHGRARREAELTARHGARQHTPVHPTASVEPGAMFSSLGVPCLTPALRNV